MSSNLVSISAAPPLESPRREQEIEERVDRVWMAEPSQDELLRARTDLTDAYRYWRRRARKAEGALRAVQDADLPEDIRARVLGRLYGNAGQRLKNPHSLSKHEQQIVDAFRATDAEGRLMLRTLLQRLALIQQE